MSSTHRPPGPPRRGKSSSPRLFRRALALGLVGGVVAVSASSARAARTGPTGPEDLSQIQHIVVLYMENHSFDNVLGRLCYQDQRCDGAISGKTHKGETVPLTEADERAKLRLVVSAAHTIWG